MCGIVGYVGKRQPALPVLLEGLKRLEYRGYDSAGLAMLHDGQLDVRKSVGRISKLEEKVYTVPPGPPTGTIGIAHTRWATHGAPTEVNAHPHLDGPQRLAVVHNGIVENHAALRQFLEQNGATFRSQTDTEVFAHLIRYYLNESRSTTNGKTSLLKAVLAALHQVEGAYAIAVLSADHPDTIIGARRGSPLVVGVGDDEYILASAEEAIVAHTANVIHLADNEAVEMTMEGMRTVTLDEVPVNKTIEHAQASLEQIELGAYPHYMLKEICEQPEALRNCLRGRIDLHESRVIFGGLEALHRELLHSHRFVITGCGTAWHAGLVGEYLLEDLARINTEVEYASELRYRNPIIPELTTVIVISQSGETADTLAALREVHEKGALALGIINVVGSTIARNTDAGMYLHVGPEIGVASTKAFTAQVSVLAMLALWMGRRRHLALAKHDALLRALHDIPDQVQLVLKQSEAIKKVAQQYCTHSNWLFLGRGYHFPVALEGALKLKEISYIHAEGLPAAEMKHGPIALITEGMPVVVIAPRGSQYDKVLSNIHEVRARGGRILAVGTEGDTELAKLADVVFEIPDVPEQFQPILSIVPLQLLAYHAAVALGRNVDRPRNLAKSVTVE